MSSLKEVWKSMCESEYRCFPLEFEEFVSLDLRMLIYKHIETKVAANENGNLQDCLQDFQALVLEMAKTLQVQPLNQPPLSQPSATTITKPKGAGAIAGTISYTSLTLPDAFFETKIGAGNLKVQMRTPSRQVLPLKNYHSLYPSIRQILDSAKQTKLDSFFTNRDDILHRPDRKQVSSLGLSCCCRVEWSGQTFTNSSSSGETSSSRVGTTGANADAVTSNSPYTGYFQPGSAEEGIFRLGAGLKPPDSFGGGAAQNSDDDSDSNSREAIGKSKPKKPGFFSSMANAAAAIADKCSVKFGLIPCGSLKIFPPSSLDSSSATQATGNILVMGKKTGAMHPDFFKGGMSNHLTEKVGLLLKPLIAGARNFTSYPCMMGISDFSRENGGAKSGSTPTKEQFNCNFPFALFLSPNPRLALASEREVQNLGGFDQPVFMPNSTWVALVQEFIKLALLMYRTRSSSSKRGDKKADKQKEETKTQKGMFETDRNFTTEKSVMVDMQVRFSMLRLRRLMMADGAPNPALPSTTGHLPLPEGQAWFLQIACLPANVKLHDIYAWHDPRFHVFRGEPADSIGVFESGENVGFAPPIGVPSEGGPVGGPSTSIRDHFQKAMSRTSLTSNTSLFSNLIRNASKGSRIGLDDPVDQSGQLCKEEKSGGIIQMLIRATSSTPSIEQRQSRKTPNTDEHWEERAQGTLNRCASKMSNTLETSNFEIGFSNIGTPDKPQIAAIEVGGNAAVEKTVVHTTMPSKAVTIRTQSSKDGATKSLPSGSVASVTTLDLNFRRIGTIYSTSRFMTSDYSDTQIHFKHQYLEEDIELRPFWKDTIKKHSFLRNIGATHFQKMAKRSDAIVRVSERLSLDRMRSRNHDELNYCVVTDQDHPGVDAGGSSGRPDHHQPLIQRDHHHPDGGAMSSGAASGDVQSPTSSPKSPTSHDHSHGHVHSRGHSPGPSQKHHHHAKPICLSDLKAEVAAMRVILVEDQAKADYKRGDDGVREYRVTLNDILDALKFSYMVASDRIEKKEDKKVSPHGKEEGKWNGRNDDDAMNKNGKFATSNVVNTPHDTVKNDISHDGDVRTNDVVITGIPEPKINPENQLGVKSESGVNSPSRTSGAEVGTPKGPRTPSSGKSLTKRCCGKSS